jgi:hypothetical protein
MLHINFADEVTGHLSIIQLRLERLCPIARRGVFIQAAHRHSID